MIWNFYTKVTTGNHDTIRLLIVDGRKGGSNLAATLVNSILCYPDSATINPGRDV